MANGKDRYFHQRNRTTNTYQIRDRYLASESIATCNYIEQAKKVTEALNYLHDFNQKQAVIKRDSSKSNTAVSSASSHLQFPDAGDPGSDSH